MSQALTTKNRIAQPDRMAIVFVRGTSSGDIMRIVRRSCAQHAAGALADLGHDLRAERVDLLVGHGLLARLDRYRDGDRFLAGFDAWAFIDVEDADTSDQ